MRSFASVRFEAFVCHVVRQLPQHKAGGGQRVLIRVEIKRVPVKGNRARVRVHLSHNSWRKCAIK
jgi:hypothetical protein